MGWPGVALRPYRKGADQSLNHRGFGLLLKMRRQKRVSLRSSEGIPEFPPSLNMCHVRMICSVGVCKQTHTYMHACMHAYIRTYIRTHSYMYICTCIYMCMCVYIHICVQTDADIDVNTIETGKCMYTHVYTYMFTTHM